MTKANTGDNNGTTTFLKIKTHQLSEYSLCLERKQVFDHENVSQYKHIPYRINIRFQNIYYNDIGNDSDSRVTDKKEVIYEYNSGYISEMRWNSDDDGQFTTANTGMVDIPSFCAIFYNLETKIREIFRINSTLDQVKKDRKYGTILSHSERLLLKKNHDNLTRLKRAYIKELVGICKEHVFVTSVITENNDKEECLEVIETN